MAKCCLGAPAGVEITEPLGVIGLITPELPIAIPAWKIALPWPTATPWCSGPQRVVPGLGRWQTSCTAQACAGVFNLVMGRGSEVGAVLLKTSASRRELYGSVGTGQRVAAACGAGGPRAAGDGRQEPVCGAGRCRPERVGAAINSGFSPLASAARPAAA